ncbi:MAG: protein phosphatase 2C domain-containing protein [Chloroflexi bacterium]|nr:protein phosphatase 2C domain-containing protein [Chloroflexota bacterium]MCI0645492.1 protein phosphatase 2C domain-containing protein [Chloroflexota bacterium]MCI0730631.1 protein phosphatase 2C domain-containing protein [Chloroflexota bacterium]
MASRYILKAAAGSHPGRSREVNQDSVLAYVRPLEMGDALGLFIVADGMGGHQAGEVASRMAVETIRHSLSWMLDQDDNDATQPIPLSNGPATGEDETASPLEKRLELAIGEANQAIHDYAKDNPVEAGNLGCTVTCAIVYGNKATIANVGDSRTYLLSQEGLSQLTDDHSYVGQLVREGFLQPEDVYDHDQRHVITRALGNKPEVQVDVWTRPLRSGDRLLLCSDGVWEMIRSQEELAQMLGAADLPTAIQELIDAANAYGGADNIGAVVVELQEAT